MRRSMAGIVGALALAFATSTMAQEGPTSPAPAPATPATPAAQRHLDRCPDNLADYEHSDATRKFVEKCLGRPAHQMPGRGDDTIYQYSARGGSVILMFVFDHAGALKIFRVYAKN